MENKKVVELFSEIVRESTWVNKGEQLNELTNITFFLGAGFSKSWDESYPLGRELFELSHSEIDKYDALHSFFEHCGYSFMDEIGYDQFVECYYRLGMYRKHPEIRPRFIDEQNINIIEREFRCIVATNLKNKVNLNYVSKNNKFELEPTVSQCEIINFFHNLFWQQHCSTGIPEGIRLNFITTNYDFIVEQILDKTISDFHYLDTYRGFTPIKTNGFNNMSPVYGHMLSQSLFKINGGLEIYQDKNGFSVNHMEDFGNNVPEIILPSKEQDYTNKYFKSIFSKTTRLLQESDILVIIGYSFPSEDLLIRFILRHFAEDGRDLADKVIFYIDLGDKDTLMDKLVKITPCQGRDYARLFVYNNGFVNFVKDFNGLKLP